MCRCRSSVLDCASCVAVIHESWVFSLLAVVLHFATYNGQVVPKATLNSLLFNMKRVTYDLKKILFYKYRE
jgi:hypothetical protein